MTRVEVFKSLHHFPESLAVFPNPGALSGESLAEGVHVRWVHCRPDRSVRVALAAGPKSRTQRQDRSWSDGEQVYLVQLGVKQEVGWSGAYRAGGSEDCRLEVTIQKL